MLTFRYLKLLSNIFFLSNGFFHEENLYPGDNIPRSLPSFEVVLSAAESECKPPYTTVVELVASGALRSMCWTLLLFLE